VINKSIKIKSKEVWRMSDKKEAYARLIIDKMLCQANWRLLDDEETRKNVILEYSIRDKSKTGRADYTLLDNYNRPIAVIEAKSKDKNPLSAKAQVKKYANSIDVRYVYLSNGVEHYFWDTLEGDPEKIKEFHSQDQLVALLNNDSSILPTLADFDFDEYIIAYLQNTKVKKLSSNELKDKYIEKNKLIKLRPYQVDAVNAVIDSYKRGNYRFLLEMATGAGKTFTCAGLISAFLESKTAHRVLFLVDRIELENQAFKSFTKSFGEGAIYTTKVYKEDRGGWQSADILISTVQSLTKNERFKELFVPTDFDLVVVDEAHRSISGVARGLFEYFVGCKVGLTATPKDFLRGIEEDKLKNNSAYEYSYRMLKDTYITFGCTSEKATYTFTLEDGVKLGMLLQPYVIDARTEKTVDLLSKDGLILDVAEDGEEENEQAFKSKDYERKLFSDETNKTMCRAFIDNAKCDPISGEFGKSIIFCVSQNHAAKITNILNKMAREKFPNMYDSDFAQQVTSHVEEAGQKTIDFNDEKNSLNGKSKYKEDYETSKTRVCVTVGMMTTGYDCKDLLNIVIMRPIFSPSEFIQIKGRGTRTHTFEFEDIKHKKDNFYLFDFFAVVEYFETEHDYDKKLTAPTGESSGNVNPKPPKPTKGVIEIEEKDPLASLKGAQVGATGMRVDKDFFSIDDLKKEMLEDEEIQKAIKSKDYTRVTKIVDEKYIQNPKYKHISIEKISTDLNLERIASWEEFVELVYGIKQNLKTHEELLEDAVSNCIKLYHVKELNRSKIRKLIEAYLTSDIVRKAINTKKFAVLDLSGVYTFSEFKSLNGDAKIFMEHITEIIPKELLRRAS
jgi:type I restriction enzyme R subunit